MIRLSAASRALNVFNDHVPGVPLRFTQGFMPTPAPRVEAAISARRDLEAGSKLQRRNIRIMSSRVGGLLSVGKGRSTQAVAPANLRPKKETRKKKRTRILRRLRRIVRCHSKFRFCWQISKLEAGILRSPTEPIKQLHLTAPRNLRTKRTRWNWAKYSLERAGASSSEMDIKHCCLGI
jgi:hypothetical protein